METVADFLAFRTLVSPSLLIVFYYLGALGVPLTGWVFSRWLARRLRWTAPARTAGRATMTRLIRRRERRLFPVLFVLTFVVMELGWRMMFEFMLAYFQMRELLIDIAAG